MECTPNMIRTLAISAALSAGLSFGLAAPDVSAQGPANASPAGSGAAEPVELSTVPTDLDTLGARIYLPTRASAQTTIIAGGRSKTVVTPEDQSYLIQVFSSVSGNKGLTAQEALTAVVDQRKGQLELEPAQGRPGESLVQEVDRVDNLSLSGMPAARSYLCLLAPPEKSVPVTGYTMVNTAPGRFLIVQLDCSSAVFERSRRVYETVCAAMQFPAMQELDTERSAAIVAGRDFLASVTNDDLDRALEPEPKYIRIFVPSPTKAPGDAREVGYQKVEMRKGQLGELDPNRPKSSWGVADREVGYLVRSDARMLQDQYVFDSRAIYFLSLDRQRESWSVLVEQKSGSSVMKTTQTLVRSGTRLSVRTERSGYPAQAKDFDLPEDQYISSVERYLLPKIVAHRVEPTAPTYLKMAFYAFDGSRETVTLRHETFDRNEDGNWVCETRPGEEQPSWTSTYSTDGSLVSRLIPPLQVMEPTTRERIQQLWKNKSLPIEGSP